MQRLKELRRLRFIKSSGSDWNDTSTIQIKQEDLPEALAALQWACEDLLNFNLTPTNKANICNVELPGRFSVLLENSDIVVSNLVENWRLLKDRYTSFEDIFKTENDIKWIQEALLYLIDMAEGLDAKLPPWVREVLKIRNS